MVRKAVGAWVVVSEDMRLTDGSTLRTKLGSDWAAVGVLLALTAVITWHHAIFDMWLGRTDITQQLMPNYWFLGQHLRDFDIPGWNPHQVSGMPFAADPLSGWMMFPVMALFAILGPLPALKALLAFQVGFAALTTYAYARVLGMGILAGLVGAIAFAFGDFLHKNAYCCNIEANVAAWIPLAPLGVELALRAQAWVSRAAAICLTGVALSQMLAAWIGQGAYYGLVIVGSYVFYRTVISPPGEDWGMRRRFVALVIIGLVVLVGGFGLAAAGFLPRLDVNQYTNVSGGTYEATGSAGGKGWTVPQLLDHVLDSRFRPRRYYFGTAMVMLALLAPLVARRRYAVPYFTLLTVVGMVLTLGPTPVHFLFYLLPRFESLHAHNEARILGVILIGPAMLAAAAVQSLLRLRVRLATVAFALLPAVCYTLVRIYLDHHDQWLPRHVWVVALGTTLLLFAWLVLRLDRDWWLLRDMRPLAVVPPLLLVAMLIWDPAGKDVLDSFRGRSDSSVYRWLLDNRDKRAHTAHVYASCEDPGGAGEFLAQRQNEQNAPLRYFGYDGADLRYEGHEGISYHGEHASPQIQALLVATRATCLGLYDVQGYSPVQLQRYVDYLRAIDGVKLNYHDAVILPSGVDSPLLDLLNPEYIITPRDIPPGDSRPDLVHVASTRPEVFRNDQIRVFANPSALPHAWVVHDARQLPKEQILDELRSGQVDPQQTVLVERAPPPMQVATNSASDAVQFVNFESDQIELDVDAAGDGMLVLSEIYAPGWRAFVDGEEVSVFAADYILRGVPVPAGSHRVELRYDPVSLRLGVWISTVTGLVMAATLFAAGWRYVRARMNKQT
jgi:hypothetical protein